MSKTSPTARSLERLRRAGYCCVVAERWIPRAKVRRDLFHVIDFVAVKGDEPGVLGVQTTVASCLAARATKAKAQPELHVWLAAGNRFHLHGWKKRGKVWDVVVVELRPGDLSPIAPTPPRPARRQRVGQRQGVLFGPQACPRAAHRPSRRPRSRREGLDPVYAKPDAFPCRLRLCRIGKMCRIKRGDG